MARQSPLHNAQADALSVCGRLLKRGQVMLVPESAIGSRERKLEQRKLIAIRKSNKPGFLQIVAL